MAFSARIQLILCLVLSGCGQTHTEYSQTAYVFGTQVDIRIVGLNKEHAKKHIAVIFQDLDRMHHQLHAWQTSTLTALNAAFAQGNEVIIDPQIKAWLLNAKTYASRSNHLFNPAAGQLIAHWGFQQDSAASALPAPALIQQWLQAKPTMDDLIFTSRTVKSTNPALALDFGGIAKGWALDRAAAYLRQNQVHNALINIGGNILALGRKGNSAWRIGLQDPRAPEPMAIITLNSGEAIGTSGDYQRYFTVQGKRYCHLLDPRSGSPAQQMISATVITPPSVEAGTLSDVATKPIFIGGVATAMRYLRHFALNDALLITAEGGAYLTPSMQARITWLRKPANIYSL